MLSGRRGPWTAQLTKAVVSSCEKVGWSAAAKGHRLDQLPKPAHEYLAIDVTAFDAESQGWSLPMAVFELENSERRLAFSLWKVLVVTAPLRVVFGYSSSLDESASIVDRLCTEVIRRLTPPQLAQLSGEVVVVIGARDDIATFPYGFFKWWGLDSNTRQFELL